MTDGMRHPFYNSRIIDNYIKLIRQRYPYVHIEELLAFAGMKMHEVADQGHWFTQKQVNLFYEKCVQLTGNQYIARDAGRYAASPDALGAMRHYVLGFVGPSRVYDAIGKTASNFTRSCSLVSKKIAPNKVEVVATMATGAKEEPFQCENRVGFLEAIVMMFNVKAPKIEHPECIFDGGNCCRYLISWETTASAFWSNIRNVATFAIAPAIATAFIIDSHSAFHQALPIGVTIISLLSWLTANRESTEVRQSLDHLRESGNKLVDQINLNYNNSLMANEIGQAISRQTGINDILENVASVLEKRLDFDRGLILVADENKTTLTYRAGFGHKGESAGMMNKISFRIDNPRSKGVFAVAFREQHPILINDIDNIEDTLSPKSLAFAKKMGAQSFICCPIVCDGETLGVLVVDNVKTKRPLLQSDVSLLMGVAPVIGISIRNSELIETKIKQFTSTLHIMAASIDARDPLTAGHSEKVTEYAVGICRQIALTDEYTEMVRVAALLHDYGKIGVPDAILKKNGRLTPLEYEVVKTHTYKTREILEQINFEGIYKQVPDVAASHHEKLNGSGYPRGLRGEEIPLGSQIIAVADFFEAITAKRHYRNPMPIAEAFSVLRQEAGEHFHPELVEALITYYNETYMPDMGTPPGTAESAPYANFTPLQDIMGV